MPGDAPIVRRAARVLVFDAADRLLLVRFEYGGRAWWAAPGGGLKDGETHEAAAVRELEEETGLRLEGAGRWVWNREHVFEFEGTLYRQLERYFFARTSAFEPRPRGLERDEARVLRGLGWWGPAELAASTEDFAPADLPALVRHLLEHGPPAGPVRVGV